MADPLDAKAVSAFKVASRELRDPTLNKAHKEVKHGLETLQTLGASLAGSPANGGRYVTATLAIGSNTVRHDLGRQGNGAFVATQSVFSDLAVTSIDATNLTIFASAVVTVKLWVF